MDLFYRLAHRAIASPWGLGAVIFVIAVAVIVFGPSSESRFIYTDF